MLFSLNCLSLSFFHILSLSLSYPFLNNVSFPSPGMPFFSFLSFIHVSFLYPSLAFPFPFPFLALALDV